MVAPVYRVVLGVFTIEVGDFYRYAEKGPRNNSLRKNDVVEKNPRNNGPLEKRSPGEKNPGEMVPGKLSSKNCSPSKKC